MGAQAGVLGVLEKGAAGGGVPEGIQLYQAPARPGPPPPEGCGRVMIALFGPVPVNV